MPESVGLTRFLPRTCGIPCSGRQTGWGLMAAEQSISLKGLIEFPALSLRWLEWVISAPGKRKLACCHSKRQHRFCIGVMKPISIICFLPALPLTGKIRRSIRHPAIFLKLRRYLSSTGQTASLTIWKSLTSGPQDSVLICITTA